MGVFDRAKQREFLLAFSSLRHSLDEARSRRCVGALALSCFDQAVQAALCDLDQAYAQLLTRAHDWLKVAIREPEFSQNADPGYDDAYYRHVLAVIGWLRSRTLDGDLLSAACDHFTSYFRSRLYKFKAEVTHNLPTFVLARKYAELHAHFRACRQLQPPAAARGIKCPGRMSYLIAQHELTGHPDSDTLRGALRSFMAYQMPLCLKVRKTGGIGLWREVPTWTLLEDEYGGGPRRDGPANIRRALEYVQTRAEPVYGLPCQGRAP
jgi:hypothetical protein